jgi:hypothetical protein
LLCLMPFMKNVIYAECHYAECHCEYHYVQYAESHYVQCCYAEYHFDQYCYAECHHTKCRGALNTIDLK